MEKCDIFVNPELQNALSYFYLSVFTRIFFKLQTLFL